MGVRDTWVETHLTVLLRHNPEVQEIQAPNLKLFPAMETFDGEMFKEELLLTGICGGVWG